MQATKGQYLF